MCVSCSHPSTLAEQAPTVTGNHLRHFLSSGFLYALRFSVALCSEGWFKGFHGSVQLTLILVSNVKGILNGESPLAVQRQDQEMTSLLLDARHRHVEKVSGKFRIVAEAILSVEQK
ncbi:hypothetical protein SRHO_G00247990 [Serrasalmus rhombeus]